MFIVVFCFVDSGGSKVVVFDIVEALFTLVLFVVVLNAFCIEDMYAFIVVFCFADSGGKVDVYDLVDV